MSIDLVNTTIGTLPDPAQQQQIRAALSAVGDALTDGEKYVMQYSVWMC